MRDEKYLVGFKKFAPWVDQAFVSAGSFLTIIICANLFSPEEQGKLSYVISIYLALCVINSTFIFQTASVQAPIVADKTAYISTLVCLQIIIASIGSSFGIIALVWISSVSGWNLSLSERLAIGIFYILQQLYDFERKIAYIKFNTTRAAMIGMIGTLIRIGLLILLKPTSCSVACIYLAAGALYPAMKVIWDFVKCADPFKLAATYLNQQTSSSRWLMASAPLVWVVSAIPTFAVGIVGTLQYAGIFFTIRSLSNVANVFMELLETTVSASAGSYYVSDKEKLFSMLRKIRKLGLAVWIVVVILFYFYGELLLNFIYGQIYVGGVTILLIFWLGIGFTFLYRVKSVELRTTGEGKTVTLGYLVALIVTAALAYPLVNLYGVQGGAWTFSISVMINYLAQKFFCKPHFLSTLRY